MEDHPIARQDPPGPSVLNRAERRTLTACAEAMLPAGGAIAISGMEAGVVPYVDQMVARSPRLTRLLVRLMLLAVEFCPLVLGPFQGRLSRLPLARRERILRALADHRIYLLRTMFLSLRALLTIAYFGHEGVGRTFGRRVVPPVLGAAEVPA